MQANILRTTSPYLMLTINFHSPRGLPSVSSPHKSQHFIPSFSFLLTLSSSPTSPSWTFISSWRTGRSQHHWRGVMCIVSAQGVKQSSRCQCYSFSRHHFIWLNLFVLQSACFPSDTLDESSQEPVSTCTTLDGFLALAKGLHTVGTSHMLGPFPRPSQTLSSSWQVIILTKSLSP